MPDRFTVGLTLAAYAAFLGYLLLGAFLTDPHVTKFRTKTLPALIKRLRARLHIRN